MQRSPGRVAQENFERVQAERSRQADALLRSLEQFQKAKTQRLQATVLDYQRRLLRGEDMDIPIRRAEYELDGLAEDVDRRRGEIEGKRHVQVHDPQLLNMAVLVSGEKHTGTHLIGTEKSD